MSGEQTHPPCEDCGAPSVGMFLGPKEERPRVVVVVCQTCGEKRETERLNALAAKEPN